MTSEDGVRVFIKVFSSDQKTFLIIGYISILIAYIIRLVKKESSFEYIKIIFAIFIFTISFNFTYLFWKDDLKFKMENRIISVQKSSLIEEDKNKYIVDANNTINELDIGIFSKELKIENTFYGVGNLMLIAILLILFRDQIS